MNTTGTHDIKYSVEIDGNNNYVTDHYCINKIKLDDLLRMFPCKKDMTNHGEVSIYKSFQKAGFNEAVEICDLIKKRIIDETK